MPDTLQSTRVAFESAIEQSDIIISTGGVSVGEHDYVKEALSKLGLKSIIWQIAVKPGRPVWFGTVEKPSEPKLIFGLPGNPVSALVTFNQFVKPAIFKMMGLLNCKKNNLSAKITKELKKIPGRLEVVRGIVHGAAQKQSLNVEPY